jgi:hypothetical protein
MREEVHLGAKEDDSKKTWISSTPFSNYGIPNFYGVSVFPLSYKDGYTLPPFWSGDFRFFYSLGFFSCFHLFVDPPIFQ